MGRSGSSPRRKRSKKKSQKVSSEADRKKARRNKSKKLRHNDDSFSSYSDDDSTSSSLVSTSSSEGELRSRRARSRSRKGSRKRTRGRSLSEDSSEDSPAVKKIKVSKKKRDSGSGKRKKNKKIKKKKKKKSRRDAYVSSASCSTCGDGDSSSDEGATHGRTRVKPRDEEKDPRGRSGHRKNSSRNRSSSPSKLSDSYDDESIENTVVENNSRRLKSVITVATQPDDEERDDMRKDEPKEEILYDYDDYPSSKSNDSNDGESKEIAVLPDKQRMLTSLTGEVDSASILNDNVSLPPGKTASKEFAGSKEKDSNAGSEVGDLESILRQKALENLSRFRGGLQTKAVAPAADKPKTDQISVKQPASASANFVQTQKRQQDGFSTMAMLQPAIQIQRSRFTWRRDPSVTTGKEEKAETYRRTDSGKLQAPAPKLQSANLTSTSSVENSSANERSKSMAVNTDNSIGGIGSNDGQKSAATVETSSSLSTKEGSSKEQQTETNDNSQFEKKTMSVMRGGEMVQVSYKVYIPNRAPALARRKLKR